MKTINVTFTDEEHEKLVKTKGILNWHDFILTTESLRSLFHAAYRFIDVNNLLLSFNEHLMSVGLDVIDEDILAWIEEE